MSENHGQVKLADAQRPRTAVCSRRLIAALQVSEKDGLVEFADALRSRLSYFDELEHIASHFHAASLAVDSTEFMPLLKRLDDCITYKFSKFSKFSNPS